MNDDDFVRTPPWMGMVPFPGPLDAPPPSIRVEVVFGARSQPSANRTLNDDHYLIVRVTRHLETLMTSLAEGDIPSRFDECGYGMVVADGMGEAAETASRLAISTLTHLAIYFGKGHTRVDQTIAEEMMDRGKRFYRGVDATLREAGRSVGGGLQTTLTVVYTVGAELFLIHVGHSRAYVFRDDQLLQLTHDHTLDVARPGPAVSLDRAGSAPDLYHMVTEAMGGIGQRIDIERCGLMDRDILLLCTNGLTDVVEDARIADVFRMFQKPDAQCRALLDLAASAGSHDAATALVGHYRMYA